MTDFKSLLAIIACSIMLFACGGAKAPEDVATEFITNIYNFHLYHLKYFIQKKSERYCSPSLPKKSSKKSSDLSLLLTTTLSTSILTFGFSRPSICGLFSTTLGSSTTL